MTPPTHSPRDMDCPACLGTGCGYKQGSKCARCTNSPTDLVIGRVYSNEMVDKIIKEYPIKGLSLAKEMGVTKPSLGGMLQRLRGAGYIVPRPKNGKKGISYSSTETNPLLQQIRRYIEDTRKDAISKSDFDRGCLAVASDIEDILNFDGEEQ